MAFMGSHGTCMSSATKIKREGFDTRPGRIGRGAYFWTAMETRHINLANDLAERWARRHEHKYRSESDRRLAVVEIGVEVGQDDILYLDHPEHHLDLRMMMAQCIEHHFKVKSAFEVDRDQVRTIERTLWGIIEAYIVKVEKLLNRKIKVVFKAQVAPIADPMRELIGLTSCFSIRDTECIKSMQVSPV